MRIGSPSPRRTPRLRSRAMVAAAVTAFAAALVPAAPASAADPCPYRVDDYSGFLKSATFLQCGDRLFSAGTGYVLIMQTDGNLVLYDTTWWAPRWASYTQGTGNFALMGQDGSLAVYNRSGSTRLYSSGIGGNTVRGSFLKVQADGKLVIYSPSSRALQWNCGGLTPLQFGWCEI